MFINTLQSQILQHLGFYGYLSVSQFSRLTGKSVSYLREQLAILRQRNLICSYHVEITAKIRAENIYYLTEEGKNIILEHSKVFYDVRVPAGKVMVVLDYLHRKNYQWLCIELIEMFKRNGYATPTFFSYFDKTGSNRKSDKTGILQSKTKVVLGDGSFFMPDGVIVTEKDGSRRLYLLELYNGHETARVIQQLAKHAVAISEGSPGKTFGISANPSVLCVFEHDRYKEAVIKRLVMNTRFLPLADFFFFSTLEKVKADCEHAFENVHKKLLDFT